MPFAIHFTKGSLTGRIWPVGAVPVVVGRSHSCTVRPTEPDVSGRHVALAAAGETVVVKVLSSHRTKIGGVVASSGDTVAVDAGTTVELGSKLVFRVVSGDFTGNDTTSISAMGQSTTGSAETMAEETLRTRLGGNTLPSSPATGTFCTTGGSGSGETCVATGLSAFPSGAVGLGTGTMESGVGSTEDDSDGTQVLQTQVVSREELAGIKTAREDRKRARSVKISAALVLAAAAVLVPSAWWASREPERMVAQPPPVAEVELFPRLAPDGAGHSGGAGMVGVAWPGATRGARVLADGDGSFRAFFRAGRAGEVGIVVAADVFEDLEAVGEPRELTFDRYVSRCPDLVVAIGSMTPLPEDDFIGGGGGLTRAVQCSRREYWCMRDGKTVWGVVSFLRNGSACIAVRRETAAAEKERTMHFMEPSFAWLFCDEAFGEGQWEGDGNPASPDPAADLSRCEALLAIDSPVEWPETERVLRSVMVALSKSSGGAPVADLRSRAVSALVTLRHRKALHWKRLVARRMAIGTAESGSAAAPVAEAIGIQARTAFSDPGEEWYYLARRGNWWEGP